ncbi:hypothetical protein L195_g014100 [Trifolium pratense]|uniref:RING/U-box protein n=1 Tax=Trifolium pratense TaxID=57577 RepID=A0A2K3PPZ6_TRIPR|nr:RING/U-box protein [Trifolium pratense]PNX93126.1 hypothetical protein L195_g016275 [Trifolium pratense]PNX94334.1 hypothetical protein L195_g017507 [Trifolium pratense]PNY17359.1 hypothetical protein L195_g014100 [Trifolium pratense]
MTGASLPKSSSGWLDCKRIGFFHSISNRNGGCGYQWTAVVAANHIRIAASHTLQDNTRTFSLFIAGFLPLRTNSTCIFRPAFRFLASSGPQLSRCTLCNVDIETGSLIPNLALRAAAAAVKHEDDRRLFRNAALRKRRKEMGEPMDPIRRVNRENGDFTSVDGLQRGVQYPFSVNEKVIIKGNRRTPEKFVGKEAVITSQCLNGW